MPWCYLLSKILIFIKLTPVFTVWMQGSKMNCTYPVILSSIQRGVYYSSIKIFNQLPQNISKYCNNIHTFKTLWKDYLVKNAFYSIKEFLHDGLNNVDTWIFIFNLFYYCVCIYDLIFVIYYVLNNFMKFVTYVFDLIAYCNLAFFHDEFNIHSDLCR